MDDRPITTDDLPCDHTAGLPCPQHDGQDEPETHYVYATGTGAGGREDHRQVDADAPFEPEPVSDDEDLRRAREAEADDAAEVRRLNAYGGLVDEAYDRLNLEDRSLDDLETMRETWALNTHELEAVNEAIAEAESEVEPRIAADDELRGGTFEE